MRSTSTMSTFPVDSHLTCKCFSIKYSTKVSYPQSRNKHASCIHDSYVYIFAGKDGNISLRDFWRFSISNYKWEVVSFRGDVPQHLEGHTLVSFKKLLLLFGGEFGDALTESSLWIINPDLGYIRKTAQDAGNEGPCIRRYHSAVVYKGAMFVYGGYVDIKGSSSELWKYHIDDEEWELIQPRQPSRELPGGRHRHTAVVYDSHMWLFGGSTDLHPKQDLWSYSFGVNRWDRIKVKYGPPALSGHTATVVGSRMFVFGGETSREAVNQLWYFSFKTEKWSQIFIKESIPARALHSAVFVSPSLHENAVKACSMPYLQKKMAKLHIERPKSSPGVRTSCTKVSSDAQYLRSMQGHYRVQKACCETQAEINQPNCQKRYSDPAHGFICYNNASLYENSGSVESIKPGSAENVADELPLKTTDYNSNAYKSFDRNKSLCGIDNPGISDSTEELIRQNGQIKHLRKQHSCSEDIGSIGVKYRSDPSVGDLLRLESVPTDTSHVMDGLSNNLRTKKSKLDPELILEDIENTDCFPYDVKLSNPYRISTLSGNSYSVESIFLDEDNIDTIELNDVPRNRSKSLEAVLDDVDSGEGRVENSGRKSDWEKMEVAYNCKDESLKYMNNKTQSQSVQERNRDSNRDGTHEKSVVDNRSSMETIFSVELRNAENRDAIYKKQTAKVSNSTQQVPKSPDQPYILILGGKDNKTVNFGVKPLPMWKLTISS